MRETDDKLVERVLTRYGISSGYWEPLFSHWRALLRNYYQELKLKVDSETGKKRWPYRSKLFTPATFEKSETILPHLIDATFSKDPFFMVTAAPKDYAGIRDPMMREFMRQKHRENVKKTEILLAYQLRERGFRNDAVSIFQQTHMLGTQILRLKWAYESHYLTQRQTVYENGIPVGVSKNRVLKETYDGPDWVKVPFYNFFIDPYTPPQDLQKARYVEEEIVQSWDDFMEDAKYFGYKNLSEARRLVSKGTSRLTANDERGIQDDPYSKDISIIYYHDKQYVLHVAIPPGTPGAGGVLLKKQPFEEACSNGKYPYIGFHIRTGVDQGVETGGDAVADYKPGGFYPMGDLYPLHQLQAAENTSINMRMDGLALGLNPPIIIAGEGLEDEENLAYGYYPGQIVHAKSDAGIPLSQMIWQVPITDNYGQSYVHHMNHLEDKKDRALGVHDTISGKTDAKNRTATGTMVLTENAMKRFSLKAFILVKGGLEQLLRQMSEMNAELIDPDTAAYAIGSDEPVYVNPEEVVRGASFNIRVAPFYSKQYIADNILAIFQPLMETMPFADLNAMWRIYFDNAEWIEDASAILPDDAPRVTPFDIQQATYMRQMEMQQMAGQQKAQLSAGKTQGVSGTPGTKGNVQNVDPMAQIRRQMSGAGG